MQSLVTPYGPSASSCGYCGDHSPDSPRSFHKVASLSAHRLSCDIYQKMIDRGWRRSGTYCYKPNLRVSCCPQYTIRLEALKFKASKSQRKLLNRWNRFVVEGKDTDVEAEGENGSTKPRPKPRHSKEDTAFSLETAIHASEVPFLVDGKQTKHHFTVTLEPSSFTEEKYNLFTRYQESIHHDEENTPEGFERFLVTSPLKRSPITYSKPAPEHLPTQYGAYHQLYRLDGKLIAVAVLDILPACVSSVYFFYDPEWEEFSLGKLSALREISLAREMHDAGALGMEYLYMGFYIQSCQKMRYKGQYAPSFLLDPVKYDWHPLSECVPMMEAHRYACFSDPKQSLDDIPTDKTHRVDEEMISDNELKGIQAVTRVTESTLYVAELKDTPQWEDDWDRQILLCCIDALSPAVAKQIIFYP